MDFRELAYKKVFKLAVDIFVISKSFPKEEKYNTLIAESKEIGKLLNFMINNPNKFGCTKL